MKRAVVVAALVMLAASPAAVQGQRHDPRYDQAIMNQSINDTLDALEGIAPVPYDANRDALVDVEAALLTASTSGKHVLIIMGGSWCHDSMALWDQFHTPRTAAMLSARYAIAWVDVGYRDRNLQIARRFGLTGIDGTPTVLILRPDGTPTNLEDAPRWRNAASRKPAAIYRTLERAAPAIITP